MSNLENNSQSLPINPAFYIRRTDKEGYSVDTPFPLKIKNCYELDNDMLRKSLTTLTHIHNPYQEALKKVWESLKTSKKQIFPLTEDKSSSLNSSEMIARKEQNEFALKIVLQALKNATRS